MGSRTLVRSCRPVAPSDVPGLDACCAGTRRMPEGRDPDRRRHRVDQGHDRRGGRPDPEEQDERGQVGERRQDLHHVEDRREESAGRGRCAPSGSRAGRRSTNEIATAATHRAERVDARLPEAEDAERQRCPSTSGSASRHPAGDVARASPANAMSAGQPMACSRPVSAIEQGVDDRSAGSRTG